VLNGLATREAFAELLSKIGVRPSDKLVLSRIEKIPDFFDPITGKFDKATYQQVLSRNEMTPKMLDTDIRDRNAAQDWAAGIQNGLAVPRAYGALGAVYRDGDPRPRLLPDARRACRSRPADRRPAAGLHRPEQGRYSLPEMREITVVPSRPRPWATAARSTRPS
jgi:peptidyl-prolyl cis-trans isomerase D